MQLCLRHPAFTGRWRTCGPHTLCSMLNPHQISDLEDDPQLVKRDPVIQSMGYKSYMKRVNEPILKREKQLHKIQTEVRTFKVPLFKITLFKVPLFKVPPV